VTFDHCHVHLMCVCVLWTAIKFGREVTIIWTLTGISWYKSSTSDQWGSDKLRPSFTAYLRSVSRVIDFITSLHLTDTLAAYTDVQIAMRHLLW